MDGMRHGAPLLQEALIHDFEYNGFGGQSIIGVGGLGTGKTSLFLQMLQRVSHLDSDKFSKTDYLAFYKKRAKKEQQLLKNNYDPKEIPGMLPKLPCKEVPETVVYSGRNFDYWHNFLERRAWPGLTPKPLVLHLPEGEEFHFLVPFDDGVKDLIVDGIVRTYSSTHELIKNLQEGGINVWYPPSEYEVPRFILKSVKVSEKDIKSATRPNWMNFELVYELMNYGYRKHVTWYYDEIHDLLPPHAAGVEWWLIDWFVRKAEAELRRCHLSAWSTTHGCNLVDGRHMERAQWYIWTGRASPNKRYSIVTAGAVRRCCIGECIIEWKGEEFGKFFFEKLPYQLPKMRIIQGDIGKINL